MNNAQRVLLSVYLPLTVFILILDNFYTGYDLVQYVKYITVVTLFLAAQWVEKVGHEQQLMCLALLCVAIADLFLVLLPTLTGFDYTVAGSAGFAAAYLCLIGANGKNFRIGLGEIIRAILVGSTSLAVLATLPRLEMLSCKLVGVLCFGVILDYRTWRTI